MCGSTETIGQIPTYLSKLSGCEMAGRIHEWISLVPKARQQRVRMNGVVSGGTDGISGIPKGRVLGPLLLVIHITDLPDCVA